MSSGKQQECVTFRNIKMTDEIMQTLDFKSKVNDKDMSDYNKMQNMAEYKIHHTAPYLALNFQYSIKYCP